MASVQNMDPHFRGTTIVHRNRPTMMSHPRFFYSPACGQGLMQQGGWDQRGNQEVWNWTDPIPLSARRDVLVFQTEPLERDVEVTGEITVTLWISSNAKDTDFTAKLIDVYPSSRDFPGGCDLNLEDGIVPARFRVYRPRDAPSAGSGRAGADSSLPDLERIQARKSNSPRHLEQQLPSIRPEPEYGGGTGQSPEDGRGHEQGVARRDEAIFGDVAGSDSVAGRDEDFTSHRLTNRTTR